MQLIEDQRPRLLLPKHLQTATPAPLSKLSQSFVFSSSSSSSSSQELPDVRQPNLREVTEALSTKRKLPGVPAFRLLNTPRTQPFIVNPKDQRVMTFTTTYTTFLIGDGSKHQTKTISPAARQSNRKDTPTPAAVLAEFTGGRVYAMECDQGVHFEADHIDSNVRRVFAAICPSRQRASIQRQLIPDHLSSRYIFRSPSTVGCFRFAAS